MLTGQLPNAGNNMGAEVGCKQMSIMSKLVSVIAAKKFKKIEAALENPVELMEEKLRTIMKAQENTVFGRKFSFSSIRTPEDYAEKVPLMTYQSLQPYLKKAYENPTGQILTSDPIVWYVQSSGTTGNPKQLPLTKRGLADVADGTTSMQMTFLEAMPENAKIFDGKILMFGAPGHFDDINNIPVGYMTGVIASMGTNFLVRRTVRPGMDIYNITDMDEKMLAYAKLSIEEDVRGFAGITTLSLAFFRRMLYQYGPWLLQEYKGTKHERRIREAISDDGTMDLATLWPELKQLVVTGIDTDPYREWISKTLPNTMTWEAYAGSEGWYANQIYPDKGLHIMPHLNYLEFIPENESENPNPSTLTLADLKKGHRYEMVLTSFNGWYRYRMGDMMTIVNTDPYEIKSIGRKGRVVNLSGEKISDAHVTRAVTHASRITGAEVIDYSVVGLVENGVPHYTIAAMFRDDIVDPVEFVHAFEDSIRENNEEFRIVRDMDALGPTRLVRMKRSYFEDVIETKHIQAKPIPLTTDTNLLAICEEY